MKPAKKPRKVKPSKKSPSRTTRNQAVAKTKGLAKKATESKTATAADRHGPKKQPTRAPSAFSRRIPGPPSGEQAGDLQGLSNVARADSESVDELIEEGNAFEAGLVEGVEEAGEHPRREIHTREVPEDDIPGEYLDED